MDHKAKQIYIKSLMDLIELNFISENVVLSVVLSAVLSVVLSVVLSAI